MAAAVAKPTNESGRCQVCLQCGEVAEQPRDVQLGRARIPYLPPNPSSNPRAVIPPSKSGIMYQVINSSLVFATKVIPILPKTLSWERNATSRPYTFFLLEMGRVFFPVANLLRELSKPLHVMDEDVNSPGVSATKVTPICPKR